MRFKFWLQPGTEECYHELLENGTSIYFMYEILNAHTHDSSIIAYFRNAYNGSIIAISTTPQRGHLEIIVNETCRSSHFSLENKTDLIDDGLFSALIDICMTHTTSDTYVKYLSVFFHVYHIEKILASMKELEHFDNSSIVAHVSRIRAFHKQFRWILNIFLLKNMIDAIHYHVIQTRENQIEVEMLNQKDLYLLQETSAWINRWAIIHIFLIISCTLFQTFFIRRLFQTPADRYRMRK